MANVLLKYGKSALPLDFDPRFLKVLESQKEEPALSDLEIGERLDSPIGSETLEEIVEPGRSILFVVPDATRRTGCGQIINLLVRRLIANGSSPSDMNVMFATGIHRPVTAEEKTEILTPFIAQRLKTRDHDPRDLMQISRMGETPGGIPIELNRALLEFDHVVLLGGVTFHYFAGFTGGRKLVCPGLASARTVMATHKLAFDCERKTRRTGVGTGLLAGNPVHEAFVEVASMIKPSFAVSTVVDDAGRVTDVYCGDWVESHRVACGRYATDHTLAIEEPRDLVIASCGGWPYDVNMIQAHKTLEAASQACKEGGTIILFAECSEGMGRDDFLDWFSAGTSELLAERLCAKYQVSGQTAWSLLRKAERFDVRIVTSLDSDIVRALACHKIDVSYVSALTGANVGYILPQGAKFLLRAASD